MKSKTPKIYRRLKAVRENQMSRDVDSAETTHPRYQQLQLSSHRRGEKRMKRWLRDV